jgi:transposase-like protein
MKHKSSDYKLTVVNYYLDMDEPSLSKAYDIFKCSKSSLFRWLKRFIETDDIENKSRKVRQTHVNFIIKTIKIYRE